jgi:Mg2+ and Co2+ transporter CorA
MLVEHKVNSKMKWIETNKLTETEKNTLLNDYDIPLEMLDYVTDIYEQSIHVPTKLNKPNRYLSRPISFLIKHDLLFTFNEGEEVIDLTLFKENLKTENDYTPTSLMIEGVNYLVDSYLPALRELTKERHVLDDLLTKKLANKDLVKLAYLQQTLTFFESATEGNIDVIEMLLSPKIDKSFSEDEKSRLEDALIEAKQIAQMVELEANIVNKISQIFDSIMNNNLNDTMKFLTVWSLALAIPTLITGFYGMNINLPVVDSEYGWLYLIIVSVLLITWMILSLKKNRKM